MGIHGRIQSFSQCELNKICNNVSQQGVTVTFFSDRPNNSTENQRLLYLSNRFKIYWQHHCRDMAMIATSLDYDSRYPRHHFFICPKNCFKIGDNLKLTTTLSLSSCSCSCTNSSAKTTAEGTFCAFFTKQDEFRSSDSLNVSFSSKCRLVVRLPRGLFSSLRRFFKDNVTLKREKYQF